MREWVSVLLDVAAVGLVAGGLGWRFGVWAAAVAVGVAVIAANFVRSRP